MFLESLVATPSRVRYAKKGAQVSSDFALREVSIGTSVCEQATGRACICCSYRDLRVQELLTYALNGWPRS
jgi:hypothetical protein